MITKCKHCNHEWDYSGIREYYTNCPNCYYKVKLNWDEEELELIRKIKRKEQEKELEKGNQV